MLLDLTIAIPVLNEEKNLSNCLKSIGSNFAQKIVVIDSGSTDRTKEIAHIHGVEVIDFKWNGKFPKKRNWYLQNKRPSTKWILFLDADEHINEKFKKEVRNKICSEDKVGYWLNYNIYFMGKKLKGGYPLKKLALFRVGAGLYEFIDELDWSKLDMEVHEHPVLEGELGYIRNKIDHLDFKDITHFINKHNEYAVWEVERFLKVTNDPSITSKWTWKQRLKYNLIDSVWISPTYFIASYFLLGGFLDGSRGLTFAIIKMSYFNQVYCRIRERKQAGINY